MIIKYKKLDPNIPDLKRYSEGAAAFDLCTRLDISPFFGNIEVPTGIAIEIPENHFGLLTLRSSVAKHMTMRDGAGIIDSDYRGEIILLLQRDIYFKKDLFPAYSRIAQLTIIPIPHCIMHQSDELSITQRNNQGFGSTGTF